MKLHFLTSLWLVALAAMDAFAETPVDYNGYKVVRVLGRDEVAGSRPGLAELGAVDLSGGFEDMADYAIPPGKLDEFDLLGLNSSLLAEDFGAEIAKEGPVVPYDFPDANETLHMLKRNPGTNDTYFQNFRPYEDHKWYWENLSTMWPYDRRTKFVYGTSSEGEELWGWHFWGPNGPGKPAIMLHGTTHAREWITTMVVEYVARQLVLGYHNYDLTIRDIWNKYDFYFVPIVNPDGFKYSQTTDRAWRKNRQPRSYTSCIGTDVNRNWHIPPKIWTGFSDKPCDDTYRGQNPLDTPETSQWDSFSMNVRRGQGIKMFIDFHAYGQYVLTPFAFRCGDRVRNHDQQVAMAAGFAERVATKYGTKFKYGPSCSTLYQAAGVAPDHMTWQGAEYAWTIELRPTIPESGDYLVPFSLPPDQIIPSGIEQFEGLKWVWSTI